MSIACMRGVTFPPWKNAIFFPKYMYKQRPKIFLEKFFDDLKVTYTSQVL